MTREATKAAAQVMLAWAEGKTVQYQSRLYDHPWMDMYCDEQAAWNWGEFTYRIKPAEPREFWVNPTCAAFPYFSSERPHPAWIKVREIVE